MRDNISPEEKLLRLIRGRKSKSWPKEEKTPDHQDAVRLKKAGLKIAWPSLSLELISRILLAMLLILGAYLLLDFLLFSPRGIEELKLEALQLPQTIPVADAPQKPLAYYSEPIKSVNLFTAASESAGQAQASPTFMQMVSGLKLQGIVTGANPQAIIEDTKANQVYFLSPGEYVGEIQLKEILPGRVKLEYLGQMAELSL